MKQLFTTDEAIKILGISYHALIKRFQRGKIEGEFIPGNRGGKSGQILKVWIDDDLDSHLREKDKKEKDRTRIHPIPVRYGVNRGEPGCHVVTQIVNGEPMNPTGCHQGLVMSDPTYRANRICDPLPLERGDGRECDASTDPTPDNIKQEQDPEDPARQCAPATHGINLPAVLDSNFRRNDKSLRIANLRFALIQAFNEEAAKNHRPRKEIINSFLVRYHTGLLLPDIHAELKKIKRSTLYNWLQLYDQGGLDALVPQYGGQQGSNILPGEKDFLLKFLLNQNQPKISDGIRECKRYLGEYSTTGPSALRRFINDFKTNHHDTWTLKRKGEKAWNDEDAPYQDRDPMFLNVGDVIVADGHKLNLHVIDPLNGKKRRAVLVLFWDWKSTYPLGWEIMFSENIQCIAVALRNALLTLGKIPGNIYIDNGRAFLAKIFTRKIRIEETEIPGMIARLGSQYRRAMPYHGQSKPIERFFLIINDRLERRLPSYTGASINDKPAYLLRNEKLARQLHDDWVPTVDDVFNIMLQWREEYIDEPRPRRQGLTARQIFDDGKGAGLDPKALCFLMMAVEVKRVSRSRFTFAGIDWEGPCIYGYRGRILIRYSLSDFSKIYAFDTNDRYMGEVTQCGKADPIKDWQAAKQIVAARRKLKKHTKEFAAFLVEGRKNPDLIDYIEAEEANQPQAKKFLPFVDSNAAESAEGAGTGTSNQEVPAQPDMRPRWKYDYEKYDWLMEQATLTTDDRKWIEDYRVNSSLYKHLVFKDAEELDRKTIGGTNERSLRSDQID
jgi:putative transposase